MGPAVAQPTSTIRILVVDDSEIVRKQLGIFLRGADRSFTVCGEAADAREALVKAKDLKPDAVILDFALPDGDGLAVARQIGAMPQKAAIFMYTMHNSPRLEHEAHDAGILQVVSKPAASTLVLLLRELARSKVSQPDPKAPGS